MDLGPLTTASALVLSVAKQCAESEHSTQLTPIHLGLALLEPNSLLQRLLTSKFVDTEPRLRSTLRSALLKLPRQDPPPTSLGFADSLVRVLRSADAARRSAGDSHIAVGASALRALNPRHSLFYLSPPPPPPFQTRLLSP